METILCPTCQTTNNLNDSNCVSCGESLASAKFERSVNELKQATQKLREATTPRKSFYSINGCGTTLLDYRALPDGTFQAIRWVIIIGLPIIPLSAYVIEPESQERSYGQETSKFTIVGRAPITLARVLRTYGIVVIALLPIILGSLNSTYLNRTLGGPMAFFAMLLAFIWAVYWIFFRLKNDSKAYKGSS